MAEDLASLDSIDSSNVMKTLETRFHDKQIYTKNGSVLIAINPYQDVSQLYDETRLQRYKASMAIDKEAPHIFAVAGAAHRNMISSGLNQAIVISGESGAGKTETARFVLQYLRTVSNATDDLEKRIHGSQPITEAFGCAKTLRNDNSSRFGKFLMLNFNQSAKIQGAKMSTYLLEKSRVTHVGEGERSYHIFYCLLKGHPGYPDQSLVKDLKLDKASACRYLASGEVGEASDRMDDKALYDTVVTSLNQQGIATDELKMYWQLLAGVLHLGNIEFDPRADNATPAAAAASALAACEHVLGLQSGQLVKALCKRKIKAGNEFVEQDMSTMQAVDGRDALSKAIYSRLFDRLITQIDHALAMGMEATADTLRVIGVVDIFGFEVFKNNSLEQLCINFANEKLQALFTKCVFKETIAAYAAEGIQADEITFKDNKDLITMFEQPKTGMWAVLNEECVVPKGTDKGFTEKLLDAHKKNAEVIATVKGKSAGEGFCIKHFAGDVTYGTEGWLNKNKDPLNGDLMVLMQFSANTVLKELFSAEAQPSGGKFKSNKFKGIITAFCTGLDQLYEVLDNSALHFVRCFKPNDAKKGGDWQDDVILRQLHTSGVLDALRVARTGYPDRMPFEEFFGMYSFVGGMAKGGGDASVLKGKCNELCSKLQIPTKDFKLGREKIFLALGVKGNLNALRNKAMAGVAGKLQAAARGMNARAKVRAIREEREEKVEDMTDAMHGDDIELLRKAISAAKLIGVGKSKFDEPGRKAIAEAAERLAELEKLAAERKAAELALAKLVEIKVSHTGAAAELDSDISAIKAAIEAARAKGVNAEAVAAGEGKLKQLRDEQQRRVEEEQRRKEEEERLAQLKESKAREAEEKRMEEERKKREAEAAAKRDAEEAAVGAAAAAQVEAAKNAEKDAEMAQVRKAQDEMRAAEEAEQRALEEEEQLRLKVLAELKSSGTQFRSAPEDVLEYAVYLGMQLDEDKELLWIADQALQAEDPEGWSQCESPNGDLYYVNQVTMQVLWQHPLDYQYQQTYLEEKKALMAAGGGAAKGGGGTAEKSPGGTAAATAAAAPSDGGKVSDDQLRGLLHAVLGSRHADLRSLLLEPACSPKLVRCYVVRHKSRMGGGHRFDFFMSLSPTNDMYCFTGKKQSVAKGCYYSISLDQEESKRSKKDTTDSFIGKVRSDRKSMEYTLYDDGAPPETKEKGTLRRELLYVNFINSLRNRNPGAMEVIVPRVDAEGKAVLVRPAQEKHDGLAERNKNPAKVGDLVSLKNREPKWNPASNMYQLDFQGRATMASCKNIQLHAKDGPDNDICFLMGKVDDNKFNIDFKHPMSCLQAFAFALIVFDNSSGI